MEQSSITSTIRRNGAFPRNRFRSSHRYHTMVTPLFHPHPPCRTHCGCPAWAYAFKAARAVTLPLGALGRRSCGKTFCRLASLQMDASMDVRGMGFCRLALRNAPCATAIADGTMPSLPGRMFDIMVSSMLTMIGGCSPSTSRSTAHIHLMKTSVRSHIACDDSP